MYRHSSHVLLVPHFSSVKVLVMNYSVQSKKKLDIHLHPCRRWLGDNPPLAQPDVRGLHTYGIKYVGQNKHLGPSTLLQGSSWSLNFQKDQFNLSIFVFDQNYPYTDVILHNTMRLMLKSHLYPQLFSLLHNLHV